MKKILIPLVFLFSCNHAEKNIKVSAVETSTILMFNAESYKKLAAHKLQNKDTAEAKICYKIYKELLHQSDSVITSVGFSHPQTAEQKLQTILLQRDSIVYAGMAYANKLRMPSDEFMKNTIQQIHNADWYK